MFDLYVMLGVIWLILIIFILCSYREERDELIYWYDDEDEITYGIDDELKF